MPERHDWFPIPCKFFPSTESLGAFCCSNVTKSRNQGGELDRTLSQLRQSWLWPSHAARSCHAAYAILYFSLATCRTPLLPWQLAHKFRPVTSAHGRTDGQPNHGWSTRNFSGHPWMELCKAFMEVSPPRSNWDIDQLGLASRFSFTAVDRSFQVAEEVRIANLCNAQDRRKNSREIPCEQLLPGPFGCSQATYRDTISGMTANFDKISSW
jgi:hypothetical protein